MQGYVATLYTFVLQEMSDCGFSVGERISSGSDEKPKHFLVNILRWVGILSLKQLIGFLLNKGQGGVFTSGDRALLLLEFSNAFCQGSGIGSFLS
jgi:hypothetical protein